MVKKRPRFCQSCGKEMQTRETPLEAEVGRIHLDSFCTTTGCRERNVPAREDLVTGCTGFTGCPFHDTPPNQRCPDPYVECSNAAH